MALPNYTDIFVAKVYEGKWYKICIQATKIDHVIENSLTVNIEKAKAIGFQNEFFNNPIIIDLKQIKYNIEVQGRLASQTTTINDASIDANNVNLTANRARWHFEHFLMNTRGSCILAWRGGSYDDYTKAVGNSAVESVPTNAYETRRFDYGLITKVSFDDNIMRGQLSSEKYESITGVSPANYAGDPLAYDFKMSFLKGKLRSEEGGNWGKL